MSNTPHLIAQNTPLSLSEREYMQFELKVLQKIFAIPHLGYVFSLIIIAFISVSFALIMENMVVWIVVFLANIVTLWVFHQKFKQRYIQSIVKENIWVLQGELKGYSWDKTKDHNYFIYHIDDVCIFFPYGTSAYYGDKLGQVVKLHIGLIEFGSNFQMPEPLIKHVGLVLTYENLINVDDAVSRNGLNFIKQEKRRHLKIWTVFTVFFLIIMGMFLALFTQVPFFSTRINTGSPVVLQLLIFIACVVIASLIPLWILHKKFENKNYLAQFNAVR